MTGPWRHRLATFMLVMMLPLAAGRAGAAEVPPDMAARLAPLLPAVVNIEAITARAHHPTAFWGSGFFVTASGMIVTNRHVIAGADRILVSGRDIPTKQATVVYISSLIDLAVLRVDVGRSVPVLTWGDSDALRVGDPVFAIGNPLGVGISVSAGIVSGLDRNIRETHYDDFIQTDAAINHGNSGGPMVDTSGHVVGIDTALYSSPHNTGSIGIGFALPAHDAAFIVDQLIRSGTAHIGWAGMQVQQVDNALAQGLGLGAAQGSVVAAVAAGGPAAQAGIVPGDVLLRIDGQAARTGRAVLRQFAEAPVGRMVTVDLLHDGKPAEVALTVVEDPHPTMLASALPEMPRDLRTPMATPSDPGMRVSERRRAHEAPVLVVTAVDPNGPAAEAGIARDDLILRARDQPVATPAALRAALEAVARTGADRVALLVAGKDGARWVALRLAADE